MALRLIDILESIHEAGYIYNDLKLHNILVDYNASPDTSRDNIFYGQGIHLIDFGFVSKYVVNGEHISP